MTTSKFMDRRGPIGTTAKRASAWYKFVSRPPKGRLAIIAIALFSACSSSPSTNVAVSKNRLPNNTGVLYYEIYGEGEPILFLAGGPGNSGEYLIPMAKQVGAHYQIILLDQRGTGKSTVSEYSAKTINLAEAVADLELLRLHLNLDQWSVLGHSWGGMLGMAYASEHPDVISNLILVTPGGMTMDFVEFEQIIMGRLTEQDFEKISYWQAQEISDDDPHKAIVEMMKAQQPGYFLERNKGTEFIASLNTGNMSVPVYQNMWSGLMESGYDLTQSLGVYQNPTLLLLASHDPGLTAGSAIKNTLPQSVVVIIDGSGHYPFIEQPDAFYTALFDFMTGP